LYFIDTFEIVYMFHLIYYKSARDTFMFNEGVDNMPITGTDYISVQILDSLNQGIKVKDIPSHFPVSLDQSKRLSRYFNFIKLAEEHLQTNEIQKIKNIGLKILYLSSLFKNEDWDGLTEILSSINIETKRDEFPLLIQALDEKRKRIKEFQEDVENRMQQLESRERELHKLEEEIKKKQKIIKKEISFLNKYPENVQSFLIEHLGIYNEKLVLSRRLDSRWQKLLKKKSILRYDEGNYIWFVDDLDGLVADYHKRTNRKVPLGTEWNYEVEYNRHMNSYYHVPLNPDYRLPVGLAIDLRSSIGEAKLKMKEIKNERKKMQEEIRKLRKTSPKTFIEAVEATNVLSTRELKQHGELQNKALKWLYNKDYIVASEITLPNGKRVDVIGYNEQGHIIIIEVKVSILDFQKDEKWQHYLEFCDEFYFLLSNEAMPAYYRKTECQGAGLLQETKNTVKIAQEHVLEHTVNNKEKIQFLVSKTLSKKFVYGY